MFNRIKRFAEQGYRQTISSNEAIMRVLAELLKDIEFKNIIKKL